MMGVERNPGNIKEGKRETQQPTEGGKERGQLGWAPPWREDAQRHQRRAFQRNKPSTRRLEERRK